MMNETAINTIVTIVSIFVSVTCAIISHHQAKSAEQYKEEIKNKLHLYDLLQYSERFHLVSSQFMQNSRGVNWNKGRNIKDERNKLAALIFDINPILPLIERSNEYNTIVQKCNELKVLLNNENLFLLEDRVKIYEKLDIVDCCLCRYVSVASDEDAFSKS